MVSCPRVSPRLLAIASIFWCFPQWHEVAAAEQQPLSSSRHGGLGNQPNIVFILSDDQDLHMDSLSYMPQLQHHLIEQGTYFRRHYCTVALCCPSRATLWTGKEAHNTNVTDVNPPYGWYLGLLSMKHCAITHRPSRWISQVCQPGFQRRLPANLAAGGRLQYLLHGKALCLSRCLLSAGDRLT